MLKPSKLVVVIAGLAMSLARPALTAGATSVPKETVTPVASQPIPNAPGKRLVSVLVSYPPGARSLPHRHARSAFIYAYVISGAVRSAVDEEPERVYRAGEGWFERPGAHHVVSENASRSRPARLLAIFIVDQDEGRLTTPDLAATPASTSIPLLAELKDRTPGRDLEQWLNTRYGAGSGLYRELARLVKLGVAEGWAANEEVGGPNYRRSLILAPTQESHWFSITAVYMNSADARAGEHLEDGQALRGQFHSHPYGEINLVAPIDPRAELRGLNGWRGAGWTAPDPGSRHYPETRGGALIALFYLPAGRIAYLTPDGPQG